MVASVVSSLTFLVPQNAAAATPTDQASCQAQGGTWVNNDHVHGVCNGAIMALGFSPDDQVKSYVYYRALGACAAYDGSNLPAGVGVEWHTRISRQDAKAGQWFTDAVGFSTTTNGVYLDGASGVKANDQGTIDCSQTGLVNGALTLWNNWTPDEALCAMGFRSANDGEFNAGRCTNAQGGSDDFRRGSNVTAAYQKAVKDRVYGGKDPSLSDAAKYLLYLKTFQKLCAPNATISQATPTGATDRDYAVRQPARSGSDIVTPMTYYTSSTNKAQGDIVTISPGSDFSGLNYDDKSCSELVKAINGDKGKNNGLADAYAKWLHDHTGADTSVGLKDCTSGATVDPVTGKPCSTTTASSCAIDGVGWIICPILTAGAGLADGAYKFLADSFLATDPSLVNTDPNATAPDGKLIGTGTYTAWKIMQGIGNVAFIIAVLIIIFSQLTSLGISNYGVKKLLPRVIVAAILVNLSFLICQVAVDVSNILGFSLKGLLEGVSKQVTAAGGGATGPTGDDSGNLVGIAATVLVIGSAAWINVGALIVAVVGAIVALFTIFVLLIARKVLIVLLIVIAPLAFVAYLLPNTEPLFQKWRKMLTSLLLLFPVIGLLYGACLLASAVLLQVAGSDPVLKIAAYMALVIPLIAVIPLLKGSLDGIGKLGGAIQSYGQKARGTAQNGAKAGVNAYKNSGFGKFRTAFKGDRKSRIAAGTFRGTNRNPLNWGRNIRARANTGINSNRPLNAITGGFGADRDLAAQAQNRKDQQEAMAMFGGDDDLVKAWAQSGGDSSHAAFAGLSGSQKAQFQKMRGSGHHRKATSHLAAAQYLSENGKGSADLVQSALARAQASGASPTVTDGARQAAIAAYRKSGRGDALADLSTAAGALMTQAQGWSQVSASSVHRDGIDATNNPTGAASYEVFLGADAEYTRQALAGFDAMEARAKNQAQDKIIAAAQTHQSAATGAAPTISSIQDAKTYFNIR